MSCNKTSYHQPLLNHYAGMLVLFVMFVDIIDHDILISMLKT